MCLSCKTDRWYGHTQTRTKTHVCERKKKLNKNTQDKHRFTGSVKYRGVRPEGVGCKDESKARFSRLFREHLHALSRDKLLDGSVSHARPPSQNSSKFASCSSVHQRHRTLGLSTKNPREKLQCQAHVDGHEDVGGVHHHGDGGEEDGVENGLFPGFQDVDAGDEQVLVVQPGQVLPQVLEVHPAGWMEKNTKNKNKNKNKDGDEQREKI